MAKLTFETWHGTYSVEVPDDRVEVFDSFLGNMVRGVALAAGWAEGTISKYIDPDAGLDEY